LIDEKIQGGQSQKATVPAAEESDSKMYSQVEAAAILGMTLGMLMDRRRAGKIGCVKDGHYIAFSRLHIEDYKRDYEDKAIDKAGTGFQSAPVCANSLATKSPIAKSLKPAKTLSSSDPPRRRHLRNWQIPT
jgi:hypothetical protein